MCARMGSGRPSQCTHMYFLFCRAEGVRLLLLLLLLLLLRGGLNRKGRELASGGEENGMSEKSMRRRAQCWAWVCGCKGGGAFGECCSQMALQRYGWGHLFSLLLLVSVFMPAHFDDDEDGSFVKYNLNCALVLFFCCCCWCFPR